jgi:hypothetical protein
MPPEYANLLGSSQLSTQILDISPQLHLISITRASRIRHERFSNYGESAIFI